MEANFNEKGVKLTTGVLEIHGKQYQVRQINTTEIVKSPSFGLALLLGFVAFVVSSVVIKAATDSAGMTAAGAMCLAAITTMIAAKRFARFTLILTTSSGNVTALSDRDESFVKRVRDGIGAEQNRMAA